MEVKKPAKIGIHAIANYLLPLDLDATKLARRLDGLPFALATAGAYLHQTTSSFGDYLEIYNESWHDLDRYSHERLNFEERVLYSTWNLSFAQIQAHDAAAAELLRLMAYFDNQDLWYELFQAGNKHLPWWWAEVVESNVRFNHVISKLRDYSLVKIQVGSYSLHTSVQDWVTEYLNRGGGEDLWRLAAHCVAQNVKWGTDEEYCVENRRLLRHVDRLKRVQGRRKTLWGGVEPEDLSRIAELYRQLDMSVEAEEILMQALQGYEKVWGSEHMLTLDTVNNLGNLYANQGKMAEAEQMYLRALQGYEKALGPEHTSTLRAVNNLGNLCANQGKIVWAEEMYMRALQGYEKALGLEHTSTLDTVNNVGLFYWKQGKMAEAREMYMRALQGKEKVWGPEHMSTLETVNNLGALYADQGEMVEAEKMYMRALKGREKVWGREHMSTLDTVYNLGNLFANQGKIAKADQMYLRALQTAAILDREELVGQLVKKTMNIDFAEEECRKALQIAADNGHETAVRLLLEKGAEVNPDPEHYSGALQAASAGGYVTIVELLLEKGAEVNAEPGRYGTALQAASAGGHEAVVLSLLSKGANVNAKPGAHGTALQAASAGGYATIVRLLLEWGAVVNAEPGYYGTALQAASAGGHAVIVKLLLDNGADFDAENGNGASLLEAAVEGDHQGVVRLLIDKGLLASSVPTPGPSDDNDVVSSSSLTASTCLTAASTNSNTRSPTSSVTSYGYEPLEEIFSILTLEVLLDPELKDLCERMLRNEDEALFMHIFTREIKQFCLALKTEHPTNIQRDSIRILRRNCSYFALRVCRLLRSPTNWNGGQLEDLMKQAPNAEPRVEEYIRHLSHADHSRVDAAAVESTRKTPSRDTASSDSKRPEDHTGDKSQGNNSGGIETESDLEQDALESVDEESNASDSSDDETDRPPQSLTKDTISWLVKSVSFHNFMNNISRYVYSPLEYVQEVLQSALCASELCSVTFNIEWDLLRYTRNEVEDGQLISTVLALSGGIADAEASACLEYCGRTWPATGEFVIRMLEEAIRNGWHSKFDVPLLSIVT